MTAGPFPIRPTSPNSECDGHRPPLQFAGMNSIVGIDLGTTNSLIGVMDAGFPILIADKNGARLTPSVVHFPADGPPLVGEPAARMRALKPAQTVYSIKRFMGLRGDDLRDKDADVSYTLQRTPGKPVRVTAGGMSIRRRKFPR